MNVYCYGIKDPVIYDYNKRLILLSVIQLSGGHFSIIKPVPHSMLHSFAKVIRSILQVLKKAVA